MEFNFVQEYGRGFQQRKQTTYREWHVASCVAEKQGRYGVGEKGVPVEVKPGEHFFATAG
jgi:hypothetical protein